MSPSGTKIALGWLWVAACLCAASAASSKAAVCSGGSSSCSSAKPARVPKRGISMLQAAHKPKDQNSFPLNKALLEPDLDAAGHEAAMPDRRLHRGKQGTAKAEEDVPPNRGAPVAFFQLHSTSSNGSYSLDDPTDSAANATAPEAILLDESDEAGTNVTGYLEEKAGELAHPRPQQAEGTPSSLAASNHPSSAAQTDLSLRGPAGVLIAVSLLVLITVFLLGRRWQRADDLTAVRLRAARLRLTSGSELQSMFTSVNKDKSGSAVDTVSSGILTRIQGRVVARQHEEKLMAPLTKRPCVIYSASVSHDRTDGVHQPPLAYHSSGVDFAIELLDAPDISVSVHHHDAALFDMVEGRYAREKEFAEACEQWRNFTLVHLTSGTDASQSAANRNDAGFEGKLEFRECALVLGATVTIVGEVARDRDGGLCMYPWRPSLPLAIARAPWITSPSRWWKSAESFKPVERDPLVGRVMASDDPKLLC